MYLKAQPDIDKEKVDKRLGNFNKHIATFLSDKNKTKTGRRCHCHVRSGNDVHTQTWANDTKHDLVPNGSLSKGPQWYWNSMVMWAATGRTTIIPFCGLLLFLCALLVLDIHLYICNVQSGPKLPQIKGHASVRYEKAYIHRVFACEKFFVTWDSS